jgi:hypothetical protein
MKIFEKIALSIVLVSFLGTLFLNSKISSLFFFLSVTLLSFSYLIFGFTLFKIKEENYYFRVLSGAVLGITLGTLLFVLDMPKGVLLKTIVAINILFSIALISNWLIKKQGFSKEKRMILLRSVFIALITSFFAYTTVHNSQNRFLLKKISGKKTSLTYNLLMFDEIDNYDAFMDNKNYLEAINSAKKSVEYGKKWRNYDTIYYEDFSGTYEFLSKAYIQRGNKLYTNWDYLSALKNYRSADSVLKHKEHIPRYPKATKSDIYWNRWNLLKTYDRLNDFENYDREIDFLLTNYHNVKDTIDLDYYHIVENVASNYAKRNVFDESIRLSKFSLSILRKDSLNNLSNYRDTYINLAKNYLVTDSLKNAKIYLDKYSEIATEKDCKILYYNSMYFSKVNIKQALSYAKKTCECMDSENTPNPNNQFRAYLNLSQIALENSNYVIFKKNLKRIKPLVPYTYNQELNISKINNTLGYYYRLKGDFTKSKYYYQQSLNYYRDANDYDNYKKIIIELKIALLNDELGIKNNLQLINNKVLDLLSTYESTSPSLTMIHNDLAGIHTGSNIKLSDSLYNITLAIHKKYNLKNLPKIGVAYNGLGINNLYLKKYPKADSLLLKGKKQLEAFYGSNQNMNQTINYLNLAKSKLYQKDFLNSAKYLEKATITANNCFPNEKTIYESYILKLQGDLALETSKDPVVAWNHYTKALPIAEKYLPKDHPFIIELKIRIKRNAS